MSAGGSGHSKQALEHEKDGNKEQGGDDQQQCWDGLANHRHVSSIMCHVMVLLVLGRGTVSCFVLERTKAKAKGYGCYCY